MKARVKKIKEDTSFSYECRTIIFNTDLVNMIGRVIEVEEECRDEVYMSDDQFYFHKSWLEFNPAEFQV